mmetsp:Transcript_51967/g.161264  ORF Transcript_51967/g.161264 Transcript_51967/m.161264 type:complete len:322 (+) Transcript_51967:287-1252(+)
MPGRSLPIPAAASSVPRHTHCRSLQDAQEPPIPKEQVHAREIIILQAPLEINLARCSEAHPLLACPLEPRLAEIDPLRLLAPVTEFEVANVLHPTSKLALGAPLQQHCQTHPILDGADLAPEGLRALEDLQLVGKEIDEHLGRLRVRLRRCRGAVALQFADADQMPPPAAQACEPHAEELDLLAVALAVALALADPHGEVQDVRLLLLLPGLCAQALADELPVLLRRQDLLQGSHAPRRADAPPLQEGAKLGRAAHNPKLRVELQDHVVEGPQQLGAHGLLLLEALCFNLRVDQREHPGLQAGCETDAAQPTNRQHLDGSP